MSATSAALQATLALGGYWTGPIDGQWTDALTAALEELQADLGVPETGAVDAATLAAVERAVADADKGEEEDSEGSSTSTRDGATTTEP